MRILFINTSDAGGGAQENGAQLMRALRDRGHQTRLAVGHRQTDDPAVEVIPNDARRSPWARLTARTSGHLLARGGPRVGRVARAVERSGEPARWARVSLGYEDFDFPGTWDLVGTPEPRPDVIHAHNLHGGYFDLRALPQLSGEAPLVLTLNDAWALTGHCAHSFECDRWRSGCGHCPHLDVYPALSRDRTDVNWRRKRSIYAASRLHVVVACEWLRNRVEASILAQGLVETRVIPQGVDLDMFSPHDRAAARRALGLPEDADIVLFAANSTRSNPFKDFATLQAVLELLGSRQRDRQLILVSVGEDGESRRVGSAELRMVGHVGAPKALVPYYRAADVYLHPARADTFPTTVLEAQACGVPVVASAVCGIPEQIEEGATGHATPAMQPGPMATAVTSLLDDPARLSAFSAAARERAERLFGLARSVDAHERWYEELRARRSGA